jgi:uncharacterized protein
MIHLNFARALKAGALAIAIGIVASSVSAQQPAAKGPPPSAAQLQLARDIIDASGAARAFEPIVPSVMQQTYAQFVQQNPDLQKSLLEVVQALGPEFQKRQPEVVDIMIQTYASHFTEAELKDLVTFYRSTTGKKLVTELPLVLEESFGKAREWGAKIQEQVTARIREEMGKRGNKI